MPRHKGIHWGDWLAVCDRCGLVYYASQLRREWTGLMVCPDDWEERHPQDYLPSKAERITPPWTRPEGTYNFLDTAVTIGDRNPMTGEVIVGASNVSTNGANILNVYANTTNTANVPYAFELYNTISNTYLPFDYYDADKI